MKRASLILRLVSLAILFGGSAAIVFAAIILVKAAQAHGIPTAEAARVNAPVFIAYAKVALAAAFSLLLAEALDYGAHQRINKLIFFRYASSILSIVSTFIFGFGMAPTMESLLPKISTSPAARIIFSQMHVTSRLVFSCIIVFALVSLILTGWERQKIEHHHQ